MTSKEKRAARIARLEAELEEAYFEKTKEQAKEIRAREKMDAAAEAFVKAKAGKDQKAYAKAKTDLHKARAAWREARTVLQGTYVQPAPVSAKAAVNNGG